MVACGVPVWATYDVRSPNGTTAATSTDTDRHLWPQSGGETPTVVSCRLVRKSRLSNFTCCTHRAGKVTAVASYE